MEEKTASPVQSAQNLSTQNQPESQLPLKTKPKISKPLIIGLIFAILVILGIGAYLFIQAKSENKNVACTMEAKICPDGSSVGRQGQKCEFAPCPTSAPQDETSNPEDNSNEASPSAPQSMYQNSTYKYSFKYDSSLVYEKSTDPEENIIESVFFNTQKPANFENNVFIASLTSLNLETEKANLSSEEEQYKSTPKFSTQVVAGKNITTATVDISIDGQIVYTNYVALVPIGNNTLRFISHISKKDSVDKVLQSLQIG